MERTMRKATMDDVSIIMEIIDIGKQIQHNQGNTYQWTKHYPSEVDIIQDIQRQESYVVEDRDDNMTEIVGTLCITSGEEPEYDTLEGQWLNDDPFVVVHRIASRARGVAKFALKEAIKMYPNVRIDTHAKNISMAKAIRDTGFTYCGIIQKKDGTYRDVYHHVQDTNSSKI